jgi:hypothetical protein
MRLVGRIGLALLGVVLAAGIALAASRLASQPIGLAGEPVSAGSELAPASAPAATPAKDRDRDRDRTSTRPARTIRTEPELPAATAPSVPVEPSGDNDSGGGGGEERGEARDGDD